MLGYFKYEKFNIRNFDFRLISKKCDHEGRGQGRAGKLVKFDLIRALILWKKKSGWYITAE